MGAVRAWAIWWVLCAALWLALVDRVALDELAAGVVAAALGATAAVLVRAQRDTVVRPRARWLARAWRPALALFGDLRPLARALVVRGVLRRAGSGTVHVLPFDAAGDDPRTAAFRVATVILGSVGPNTIIVDIDADAGVLYAHQLMSTGDPAARAMPLGAP